MNATKLFQENKDLTRQLSAVTHANWFGECLVYARATLIEEKLTAEELNGAMKFEHALIGLAADPESEKPPVSSGLQHNIDVTRRTSKTDPQSK